MRQNTGSGVLFTAIGLLVGIGIAMAMSAEMVTQGQALQHLAEAYGVATTLR